MLDPGRTAARRRRPPPGWLALALPLLLPLAGAGPPEVVRIRVPSAQVGAWFPPGTPLRGLSTGQLDALVDSARQAALRREGRPAARLLRARHSARWESGTLVGRSELVVEPPRSGPAELTLAPWTPAIDPPGGDRTALRLHDDGRTALRVDASPDSTATLTLGWRLRARPGSQGRGFRLGLPAAPTASLALDLPSGWVPEGPAGIRQGPDPGAAEGRSAWRFDGDWGAVDLELRGGADGGGGPHDPRPWVSGPTRLELGEASARWAAEWTVDVDPRGPRQLRVELDEGLELLEVTGPAVRRSRVEAAGAATRATIVLDEAVSGPTPVTLRATARVPAEGRWAVPSARPLDAVWTGGRTTVRVDPGRVVRDCVEGAGRRVPWRPGDAGDVPLLVFEAEAPGPVATLVFGRPGVDAAVEVRGQLLLGNAAPRLEAQLAWRVHRGRLLAMDVDLPPAWVPERVQILGIDEPTAWHPEPLADGGVRVRVAGPSGEFARNSLALSVAATAAIAGGRGEILLPRVRPVGLPVVDERWVAWTESGVTLQPVSARGLAWIDPGLVIGPSADRPDPPAGLREALAWRWVADRAEARVERDRVPTEPSGRVHLLATAGRDQLRLDWRISVDGGEEASRSVLLGVPEPVGEAGPWRFVDEASGAELDRRPVPPTRRAALGLPEAGDAWELVLPDRRRGPIAIRSTLRFPWRGRGTIPLLVLPERFRSRNLVVVDVARHLESSVESGGLLALDPANAGEALGIGASADDLAAGPDSRRRAYAFAYARPGGRLELRTEPLEPSGSGGVIDQAVLTTFVDPDGPSRHRLNLRMAVADARTLDLTLPEGAALTRVRRDGQPVGLTRHGGTVSVALTPSTSSRSSCLLTLDYQTPRRASGAGATLRPERPAASLPYLAFRWEVIAPEPWAVADHGSGLIAADPEPAPGWLRRILGPWRRGATGEGRAADALRALDRLIDAPRAEEATLGEWVTRWDAGPMPLVVDRMALESAGWGPRSRFSPLRGDAGRPGAGRAHLHALGLALSPVGRAVLVTTLADDPRRPGGPLHHRGARDAWEARLAEAVARGSDVSDRFQTVARWRGEATPKGAAPAEPLDHEAVPEGWRIRRFVASGWPESGTTVRLVDERRTAAWAWAAGLLVLLAGVVARDLDRRRRAEGLAVVLLASFVASALAPVPAGTIASGALVGALAVLAFWSGRALPGRGRGRSRDPRTSTSRRVRAAGSGLVAGSLAALALVGAGRSARLATASADEDRPIIALCPFDGVPDLARPPDRAVLRLEDYQRLRRLAEAAEAPRGLGLAASDAMHRVRRQDDGEVIVESDFNLDAPEDGPSSWTFPVGQARDITATLDGDPCPVLVQPGVQAAAVQVAGRGRHRLRVRRVVTARPGAGGASIAQPVNPLATARVEVGPVAEGRRVDLPGARGPVSRRGEDVVGALGPADRLEVRWVGEPGADVPSVAGSVEGLLLWEAEPSGDRVWARLTYRNPEGTSSLRLRVDPGVVIRAVDVPGLAGVHWDASPEGPEWAAGVDPPLPDGTTVRLECWRPRAGGGGPERALPRLEPVEAGRFSGAIGFRRPSDWSGRLPALPGGEPISEEAFVRAWGNLPERALTLAGATRFVRTPAVAVTTGPEPPRRSVQPVVQLGLGPGRIDLDLRADLVAASGYAPGVEIEVPAGLTVVRVEADGLTDWNRTADRLRIRFDGPPLAQRAVRVQGWLPVPYDPTAAAPARPEVAVPWPRWRGVDEGPGTLVVSAAAPFRLDAAAGVSLLPGGPASPGSAPPAVPAVRATYRVDRPEGLGRLSWEVQPPRVDVQVRSQLTLHPEAAEWVAILRYDVSGGPGDAIRLTLPTAWAEAAEVTLAGAGHRLTSEARGTTTSWTLHPERPIWGSQRLTVRSVRPLAATRTLHVPELRPQAPGGGVDTYLAIADASGRGFQPEGSLVQEIDDRSRFPAEEFSSLSGPPTWVYHASAPGWSLKVEAPGEARPAGRPGTGPSRGQPAEVECILRGDGSALGSLRCEAEAGTGPFLPLELPGGAAPLWSSVNGVPARPLRASSGRWLIPLDVGGPSQVTLIWEAAPPATTPALAPLPALDLGRVPLFVSLRAADSLVVSAAGGGFEAVTADRLEVARAEALRRAIVERVGQLDRSSLRDRESLVSSLVQFGLVVRGARRAAAAGPQGDEEARRLAPRLRAAQSGLAEALSVLGYDDLEEAARVHLGEAPAGREAPEPEVPEAAAPVRIRRLGRPHEFQGDGRGASRPPLLFRAATRDTAWPRSGEDWAPVAASVLVPAAAWWLVRRAGRRALAGALALILAVAAMAAVGGPWAALAGLAIALLGWVAVP